MRQELAGRGLRAQCGRVLWYRSDGEMPDWL